MTKRHPILIFVVLAATLASVLALGLTPALAQEEEPPLICPDFPDADANVRTGYYMGQGAAYFSSGQYTLAIDSFSCVIEQIDSDYVAAYLSRALAHVQRFEYEEALTDYNAAIGLDSTSIPALNNRGIVYVAISDYDNALADFNQVLSINGDYIVGLNNRAVVYGILSRYDEAIADLQHAIDVSNIDTTYNSLIDPEIDDIAVDLDAAYSYALLGIIYSAQALDNYERYLTLAGSQADGRIQGAAGSLQSRFNFELRLADGTWLLTAAFDVE